MKIENCSVTNYQVNELNHFQYLLATNPGSSHFSKNCLDLSQFVECLNYLQQRPAFPRIIYLDAICARAVITAYQPFDLVIARIHKTWNRMIFPTTPPLIYLINGGLDNSGSEFIVNSRNLTLLHNAKLIIYYLICLILFMCQIH